MAINTTVLADRTTAIGFARSLVVEKGEQAAREEVAARLRFCQTGGFTNSFGRTLWWRSVESSIDRLVREGLV